MNASQRGMVLIEVLVASAVLGIGLMGASRLTLQALSTAADTRLRTTAHSLAQDALACQLMRRTDCPLNDQITAQGTLFTLQTRLQARSGLALTDIEVTVQWTPVLRPASGETTTRQVLRSSVAQVPGWVGVSSP